MSFIAMYEREGSPPWKISSWDDANLLLSYLRPEGPSYVSFSLADGSYVQCAGGLRRLTVEARLVTSGSSFHHFVFGRGPLIGRAESIACRVGPITVDASQVLTMRHARLIIRHFVEQRALDPRFTATDVTSSWETRKP